METLYPSLFVANSEWLFSEGITEWSKEENKRFERALAIYDEDEPDRWIKVAAMIPGKTVYDVIKQYRELEDDVSDIEAGKVPIPGYDHNNNKSSSNFTLEWIDDRNFDEFRKRPLGSKSGDQERKKGVPWTEDEHRRFLLGLLKHGKGDWRNISRNFVVSKTPTQVASHAQKYFIRQQLSGVKDKRRPSIHDITTVNFADTTSSDGREHHKPPSTADMHKMIIDWNYTKPAGTGTLTLFDSKDTDFLVSSPNEIASAGFKFQGQNLYAAVAAANMNNPHNLVFQRYQIHG
ncbi:transcription factor DIVARICATA-like [Euphorbia lathyris]|uniref:transcription factor DIVARICATA-like n=1 Tax=Euphorbia lathyris TaxID=212925 RepID=UPI0033135109